VTAVDTIAPRIPAPDRIGQSTAVEQSRAVAEVEAAIVVAMRHPRNVTNAIDEMRETCKRKGLAERAFFAYPKGGKVVSGPSIHLAKELVRIWGNVQWGLRELRRDDEYGQSEMLAFCWDVQTNTRNDNAFINPHRGYTGNKELGDLREIYENNANVGARRARSAIFNILPTWFVDEAIELCDKTLKDGGGIPLPQRRANAVEVFGNIGVSVPQLEARMERKVDQWTDHDVAQLRIIRQSLLRGEITKDEVFPPERTLAADVLASAATQTLPPADRFYRGEPAPGAEPDGTADHDDAGQAGAPADPPMRREPTTVPAADVGTDPAENEGPRNQGPQQVRPSDFGRLLARIPLGPIDHVHDFLSWKAGRKVTNLKDLTDADMSGIAQYLTEALDAVGNDPAEAASAIWADFATEGQDDAGQEPAE
jgi:hypothetical protein